MAKFVPKKIDLSKINGGNTYGYEGIQPNAINDPIQASAYAQALATNQPDISNIDGVGTPSVSIRENADGTPQLVFSNLKGDAGIGDATLDNTHGESTENGYTKNAVNSLVSNPNLLLNAHFRLNQRGKNEYMASSVGAYKCLYTVDRWCIRAQTANSQSKVTPIGNGVRVVLAEQYDNFAQAVEYPDRYVGKSLTFSLRAKNTSNYAITARIQQDNHIIASVNIPSYSEGVYTCTGTVLSGYDRLTVLVVNNNTSSATIEIYEAKLEIGSVATAFNYVNPTEELASCRRYYQVINKRSIYNAMTVSGEYVRAMIWLEQSMRDTPTVSVGDISNSTIFMNGSRITPVAASVYICSYNLLTVNVQHQAPNITVGHICAFVADRVEMNAEMYW
jgi:hypothetical protein